MYDSMFNEKYFGNGYVVFEHETNLWWLRFLKKGFRHCYLLLKLSGEKEQWLEINPMSNQICFFVHANPLNFDYIYHLKKKENIKVIPVKFRQAPLKAAPLAPFTCVEFVKRVLGIHDVCIATPYKLYKYLTITQNCRKKVLTNDFF